MRFKLTSLVLLFFLLGFSQDKNLTIQEAIAGYHLYPRNTLNQLQWLPGGERYSHSVNNEGEISIVVESVKTEDKLTITLSDIKNSTASGNYITSLPFPIWISNNEFRFHAQEAYYAYNIDTKKSRELYASKISRGLDHAPNQTGYVHNVDHGIEGKIKGKEFSAIPEKAGIEIGTTVHRSEFGIIGGLFWSPKGNSLAYYYKDETMVTEYPLYVLEDTPATAKMMRYPTAGGKSHHVQLHVQHADGSTVILKTRGPKEQYLTNVSWTPDEKFIFIAEVNREQNHMWLNKYDANTGDFVKTLFEESNDKYVEPEHPALFLASDPSKFIWWSERDGYNHLYLYNDDGSLDHQITKGNWVVTEVHGFSANGKNIFISTTKETPTERHLYCVELRSGKMKKITTEAGYHSLQPNEDCTLFFDSYSSTTIPGVYQVISSEGETVKVFHKASDPLSEYKLGDLELGIIKGKGGEDLHYRLFKPVDFDPNKKYPVVVYLYNGPHAQMVTNRWLGGANMWYQYMAQHGYAVFTIDGRGSAYRGFDFESAIFRNCAEKEMEDQLSGVEWLKAKSWVDGDRMGIHGWSYGGFMTTSMMSRNPGVFKVGVAGGPVIDWSLYEIMYTERYMDTPKENPEGYAKTNLKNHISNLEGKLLMIHGGQDNVVLWQHSLQYIQEAIKLGVQLDYFVYPHHEHNVRGQDRVHLYDKVSNYFFDNL